jgi:hypothetical protein
MSKRVDVEMIAEQSAEKIIDGQADDRLYWLDDHEVRVQMGNIFPLWSEYKQTVQSRRSRLGKALIDRLTRSGWTHLGKNIFGRTLAQAPRVQGESQHGGTEVQIYDFFVGGGLDFG